MSRLEVKQLKIGNHVFDKFRNREVLVWGIEANHDQIVVNYANGSGIYTVNLKDVEIIPLTEEWLLKFGFKVDYMNLDVLICAYYGENPLTKDYVLELKNVGNGWFYHNGHFKIDFVHQLQNLYFALCGEELELK